MAQIVDAAQLANKIRDREIQRRQEFPDISVTIAGEERVLKTSKLGPQDDDISQTHSGRPISIIFTDMRTLALPHNALLIWWYAGFQDGHQVTYRAMYDRFPTYESMEPFDVGINKDMDKAVEPDPLGSTSDTTSQQEVSGSGSPNVSASGHGS